MKCPHIWQRAQAEEPLHSHPIVPSVGSLSSIDLGSSPPASHKAAPKGPLLSRTAPVPGPQVPALQALVPSQSCVAAALACAAC